MRSRQRGSGRSPANKEANIKVFITGASGFIGSHLAEALRDAGHEVTGLASYRSADTHGWLDEIDGVAKVRGDVRDPERMRALIKGHELVYHLAALGGIPGSYDAPRTFMEVNATGTLNVLLAAREAGAKVIHTSTSEVYGSAQYVPMDEKHPINPQSPYAASKFAADALANAFRLSYGLPVVIIRPFNVYGPRQSERAIVPTIIRQVLDESRERVELGNLESCRDLTYVGDTVRGIMLAAGLDDIGPWHIGGGYFTSIGDLARIIMDATGIHKPIISVEAHERPVDSEVRTLKCDATKFTKATGWKPTQPFSTGLSPTIGWFRSRPRPAMGYMV